MSDYVHEKCLRVPAEKVVTLLPEEDMEDAIYRIESENRAVFNDYKKPGEYFQLAPVSGVFFDYVLFSDYGADCGEFTKHRALYDTEKAKYLPVFQQVFPNINMDHVRLVEYCWYNCSEAPDCYDDTNDDFYNEV